MNGSSLKIKKRGEDGNRVISVRIKESTLDALDKIAAQSNYSRNEIIKIIFFFFFFFLFYFFFFGLFLSSMYNKYF